MSNERLFKLNRKPIKTNKSDKLFVRASICWLCWLYLLVVDKISLFCKLSGIYLGAAHQSCLDYVNKINQHNLIPVLYHNFSRYDNHMFFNDLINSKK